MMDVAEVLDAASFAAGKHCEVKHAHERSCRSIPKEPSG